jgi:hypothetical protein
VFADWRRPGVVVRAPEGRLVEGARGFDQRLALCLGGNEHRGRDAKQGEADSSV